MTIEFFLNYYYYLRSKSVLLHFNYINYIIFSMHSATLNFFLLILLPFLEDTTNEQPQSQIRIFYSSIVAFIISQDGIKTTANIMMSLCKKCDLILLSQLSPISPFCYLLHDVMDCVRVMSLGENINLLQRNGCKLILTTELLNWFFMQAISYLIFYKSRSVEGKCQMNMEVSKKIEWNEIK